MAVRITEALKGELDKLVAELEATNPALAKLKGWERLVSDFAEWKAGGEAGKDDSFYFGKDNPYVAPKLEGGKQLWHVHLPPMADRDDLERWNKAYYWRKKSPRPKVSNRVLVYCQDGDDYLLIYVLAEPDAHAIAKMKTEDDEATMRGFARVAEAFIQRREIIA
jgi:hypothetical protein